MEQLDALFRLLIRQATCRSRDGGLLMRDLGRNREHSP
jgi:hypothetical protein